MWDSIWINANIVTMHDLNKDYDIQVNSAIGIKDGLIVWVGSMQDLADKPNSLALKVYDAKNKFITPGLIDSHTHVVYSGSRWPDFLEKFSNGSFEADPSQKGIQYTVSETRSASFDDLYEQSSKRAKRLIAEGVTTLEIKTGYGLDLDTEAKMAKVSRKIANHLPVNVYSTFLGAHALSPDFKDKSEYINYLCNLVIPCLVEQNLIDGVDIFCDFNGFSLDHLEQIFKTADQNSLYKMAHTDQYSNYKAGLKAAELGACGIAHLEHADEATAKIMAKNNSVAILLPSVSWTQDIQSKPPVKFFRENNVAIALATNINPGSSICFSPAIIMNKSCHLFGLTPYEALAGFTINAAKALKISSDYGSIEVNKFADLAIWDINHPVELASSLSGGMCVATVHKGEVNFN